MDSRALSYDFLAPEGSAFTQAAPKNVAAEVTRLKYFGGLLVRSIIPPGSMSVRR